MCTLKSSQMDIFHIQKHPWVLKGRFLSLKTWKMSQPVVLTSVQWESLHGRSSQLPCTQCDSSGQSVECSTQEVKVSGSIAKRSSLKSFPLLKPLHSSYFYSNTFQQRVSYWISPIVSIHQVYFEILISSSVCQIRYMWYVWSLHTFFEVVVFFTAPKIYMPLRIMSSIVLSWGLSPGVD